MTTIRTLQASAPLAKNDQVQTLPLDQPESKEEGQEQQQQRALVLAIQVNHDGAMWRGLQPLLFQSPPLVARKAIRIMTRHFRRATQRAILNLLDDDARVLHLRTIPSKKTMNILLLPPQCTAIQYIFEGLLIRHEHIWLSMHTMSAWIATLGGGYFLCRHLSTAVFLAKQQRALALWMGDYQTADQCTLNEAFNYIHAGRFVRAQKMILAVQATAQKRQDTLTLRMVTAASLFLQRVQRASKTMFVATKDDTVDDYQRIRVFQDRSSLAVSSSSLAI